MIGEVAVTLSEGWVSGESRLKWSEQLTRCIKKPVPCCFLGQGNIATLEVVKAPTRERIAVEVFPCFLVWETNDSSLCRVASERSWIAWHRSWVIVLSVKIAGVESDKERVCSACGSCEQKKTSRVCRASRYWWPEVVCQASSRSLKKTIFA